MISGEVLAPPSIAGTVVGARNLRYGSFHKSGGLGANTWRFFIPLGFQYDHTCCSALTSFMALYLDPLSV